MNPILSLVLVVLIYLLIVGALASLRRETFSLQFFVEALVVMGLAVLLSLVSGWVMHPVFVLALVYLVTMRARLLADLGHALAGRGHHELASSLYRLGLRLWPDQTARQILQLNQAVHHLKQDHLGEATNALEGLLKGSLSPKHEAAARYNLAVACQRQGYDARAIVEFNKVLDLMPGSLYGMGAQKALKRARQKKGIQEQEQAGGEQD